MAISLIMHAKKPRRSPLRLRFLTIALAISPLLNSIREHIRETPPYLKIQERYQTVRGRDIFSSAPLSFLWQERQTA